MDLNVFERDCEQACYRFLEEYKQRISEEGWPDDRVEEAISDPHILTYLHYRYRVSGNDERVRADSILACWKARAGNELRDYWDAYKRRREENKKREARDREDEEEREKERSRQIQVRQREREQEEEEERERQKRSRLEEERKREEAKREEQARQNKEKLSKIQEEWKKQHTAEAPTRPQAQEAQTYCPSCGAPNAKSAKFCTKCGTPLLMKCPSCGALFRVGAKFCSQCGSKVGV